MAQLVPDNALQLCVAERYVMFIKSVLPHISREMLIRSWWIGFSHHLSPFGDMEVIYFFDMIILNKL